ncbi:hypothetical protein BC828DRAFT_404467 [Blastocladiella britannica]|nr:hypothetical protein BC828DRAFT_404467 [Blastocladiella britannica]
MNISKPIGAQLSGVSFGFYSADEIRKISVKPITNPTVFDGLGHPQRGGVYDPALGPFDKGSYCATCSLSFFDCPGHFGHIELPLPIYNPSLFDDMFKYLRATCLFCFKLRISQSAAHVYKAKLLLLSRGLLVDAMRMDDVVEKSIFEDFEQYAAQAIPEEIRNAAVKIGASAGDSDSDGSEAMEDNRMGSDLEDEDMDSDDEEVAAPAPRNGKAAPKATKKSKRASSNATALKEAEYVARVSAYVQFVLTRAGASAPELEKLTAATKYRRELQREILLRIGAPARCTHCHAPALKLRAEGAAKIFISHPPKRVQMVLQSKGLRFSETVVHIRRKLMLETRAARLAGTLAGPTAPTDAIKLATAKKEWDAAESSSSSGSDSDSAEDTVDAMDVDGPVKVRRDTAAGADAALNNKDTMLHDDRDVYMNPSLAMSILDIMWSQEGHFLDFVFLSRLGKASLELPAAELEAYIPQSSADKFFIVAFPVPPTKFRPAAKMGDMTFDHPQNAALVEVLKAAQDVREFSKVLEPALVHALSAADRSKTLNLLNNAWQSMQLAANGLIDSTKNPMLGRGGKDAPPGIRQLLEKKEGLFRKHMMGKRVNYAARSVISPDPWIETSEIGIPPVFARKLTYPEPVTGHNVRELMQCVMNGPDAWPGATHIQLEDGQMQSLENLTAEQRAALAAQLLTPQAQISTNQPSYVAHTNKKVYRHLRNGDILLLNRQPTLHKPSIMAHRARVLPGEKTLRLHYANCNTYNADFDGDEMNVHFPQNEVARAEAYMIANTDNQYLAPTAGAPLRGLIQDHVVTGVRMCSRDTFLSREDYQQLIMGSLPADCMRKGRVLMLPPALRKPKPMWTGKQVISTLLLNMTRDQPPLNLASKARVGAKYWGKLGPEEAQVVFCEGELMTGVLDKSQFGASAYGLVHSVYELYGPGAAGDLLGSLSRLFSKYAQMVAFSCRMDDLILTKEGDKWRRDLINGGSEFGGDVALDYTKSADKAEMRTRLEEVLREDEKLAGLDSAMKSKMNGLTSSIISKCLPDGLVRIFPHNGMQLMTVSGAKGSNVNVSQISCCLGQQELEGRRVPIMVSGKSLPSFVAFDPSARAGGFISGRFLTGIKPQEYYFHCMAGREGLIDTAVKTSRSGYLQRCLMKHLEGMRVHYDGTVRDADGSVMQFFYGEDGLDVTKQQHLNQFRFCAENVTALNYRYRPQELVDKLDGETAAKVAKSIKKKSLSDTVLSKLSPYRYIGSTSDKFSAALDKYVDSNPDDLLFKKEKKKFNNTVKAKAFQALMQLKYLKSLVEPGEAVGVLAAQSIGEPSTQMTLNTFHFAGFGAKNVTLGIPRLREIVMTASSAIKTPAMTLTMRDGVTADQRDFFCKKISRLTLGAITQGVEVRERVVREGLTRSRKYRVRVELFSEADYSHVYHVKAGAVRRTLNSGFLKRLDLQILRELKKVGKRSTAAAMDASDSLIEVRADTSSHRAGGGGDADADEPEAPRPRGRRTGKKVDLSKPEADLHSDDDDADDANDLNAADAGDGDATESKYSSRAREQQNYDEDEDDVEIREKLDKAESDQNGSSDADSDGDSDSDSDDVDVKAAAAMQAGRMFQSKSDQDEHTLAAMNSTSYTTGIQFDHRHGAWYEVELTLPADAKKLMMVQLVENAIHKTVLHEVAGIDRCFAMENEASDDKAVKVGTDGVNLHGMWEHTDVLDEHTLYTNDIAAILRTYGVEAARGAIIQEIAGVFDVYGIDVDKRHLSLIADYMTFEGGYKPFNRIGMGSNPSPFLQMSYETTCGFLKTATMTGDVDTVESPSARIVLGKVVEGGTGSFDVLQSLVTVA